MFAEKNFVDGNFSREGYDYYLQLRERMLSSLPAPHALVYLDTSAEVCYDRIHKLRQRVRRLAMRCGRCAARGLRSAARLNAAPALGCVSQGCEGGIPLEYLAGLDECYKNFVTSMQGTKSDCLTVPWNTFGSTEYVARPPCVGAWLGCGADVSNSAQANSVVRAWRQGASAE